MGQAWTISTGATARRSRSVKETSLIASSFLRPAASQALMSLARTGPHWTLKPEALATSGAATPGGPQAGEG